MNQVVLWDKIILRSERVVLDERRLTSKYYFLDEFGQLRDHQNVTLVLRFAVFTVLLRYFFLDIMWSRTPAISV